MFTSREADIGRSVVEDFKQVLLTGSYDKCISYINSQTKLRRIFDSHFNKSRSVKDIMNGVKISCKEDLEQKLLFNILMLWHDESCYQPWIEMCEAFKGYSLLHSYECFFIYYHLVKKELSKPGMGELKVQVFRKWEALKNQCIEKELWVEAFYAAFYQANISDEYLINYITLLDYNMDKLNSSPALQNFQTHRLIEASRRFLEKKLYNKALSSWIQAILYEIDGDMDKSMEFRINEYKKHKRPMVLIRKLYSIKEFDRIQAFLEEESKADPQNPEIQKSFKWFEILKLAAELKDKNIGAMLEEAVFKAPEAPSGERLSQLCKGLDNHDMRRDGVEIFSLFQQLFPLDHEICKYYAKILEADEQIEEALRIYELMLVSGYDEKRTIADIRIITIAALMHDRYEYAMKVFSKLDEMVELRAEIDRIYASNKRKELTDVHKLFMQVKKELSALTAFYIKVTELYADDDFQLKKAFRSFVSKVEDYDCIGMVDDLLNENSELLLNFGEVKEILNITAVFSHKIFPLKFYIMDIFINCLEYDSEGYVRALNIAGCVDIALSAALKHVYADKDRVFLHIKETVNELMSYSEVNDTLKASIAMLHKNKDNKIRRFVLLLMASLFNCSKNIKSIYSSDYDKELNKELIIELSRIYIQELNRDTRFHMKLGYDLLECLYIEEAKGYFEYAMNNLPESEKGGSTSTLMYHVCDLLFKMERGIEIDPDDYDKKSFFAKAVLSIVQNPNYSDYISGYLSNNKDDDSGIMTMINAFKAAEKGCYDDAYGSLQLIKEKSELYEACEIQISSLLGKKKSHAQPYARTVQEEGSDDKDINDESSYAEGFIRIFDDMDDTEKFLGELLEFIPVLSERISACGVSEKDLEGQYKVWSGIIDRYVGRAGALSISELSNRSDVGLKAAIAAKKLGLYNEFFKYMEEYCETELELLTNGEKVFSCQASLAYEAHLLWYAKYKYCRLHNLSINKSDRKLSSFHMAFFKAYTLIDDFSALQKNIIYAKNINLILSKLGYRFMNVYEREYRDGKEGVLSNFYSFAAAVEQYSAADDINYKRKFIDKAVNEIKKMEEVSKQQFFQRDMYDVNAFINNLMYVCTEEIKKLENKPVIKVVFLNREDVHTKIISAEQQPDRFQGSFHFMIENEGNAKAENLTCTIKLQRNKKVLDIPYVQEKQILREGEKLPIGFKYTFEEEGEYEVSVETRCSEGEYVTCEYSIEVKCQGFGFQRISENTYPTSPIDDESKFFGRKAIVQRIQDCLYDENDRTTFLIYGLRRVGKTSLLNHIENIMQDRYCSVQCDCQNVFDADNTGQLVYQLFVENIVYGLSDDYGIDMYMPSEEAFERSPLRELKRFFVNVERSIGDRSLLLLIDEFDEVVRKVEDGIYSDGLFDFIRTNMQHSNKIRFMIAGGEYLLNIMKKKALKISDTAKPMEVGFLEPEEAREMIEKPFRLKGIKCEPSAVDRILMITCGHPYFITAVGNRIVELLNQEKARYTIYPDDVEYVSDKLLDMTQRSMYEHFWNSLDSSYKKLVVAVIAEQSENYEDYVDIDKMYDRMKELISAGSLSGSLYKDKVRAVVNELMAGRILSNDNKDGLSVCISVEQLRRWTRRWKNVDEVLNEIQGGTEDI